MRWADLSARTRQQLYDFVLILMVALLAFTAYSRYVPYSLVWNRTASIPEGLYLAKERDVHEPLRRGDVACFRYVAPDWARERHYFPDWMRLCKPVAAVPGDEVSREGAQLYVTPVHGERTPSGELSPQDSRGRVLPQDQLPVGTVPSGHYVLLAPAKAKSFDSRYLGLIASERITVRLTPLYTFSD